MKKVKTVSGKMLNVTIKIGGNEYNTRNAKEYGIELNKADWVALLFYYGIQQSVHAPFRLIDQYEDLMDEFDNPDIVPWDTDEEREEWEAKLEKQLEEEDQFIKCTPVIESGGVEIIAETPKYVFTYTNDGYFTSEKIERKVNTTKEVIAVATPNRITIYDAIGSVIYNADLDFTGGDDPIKGSAMYLAREHSFLMLRGIFQGVLSTGTLTGEANGDTDLYKIISEDILEPAYSELLDVLTSMESAVMGPDGASMLDKQNRDYIKNTILPISEKQNSFILYTCKE